jgi:hypothetical protein
MSDVTLSPAELEAVTGGYKRPGDQLRELHDRGFVRARIGKVTGKVILERAHYDAVSAGAVQAGSGERPRVRPSLRAVK